MLRFIENKQTINDRNVLTLTPFNNNCEERETFSSKFVMFEGTLSGENLVMHGTIAAVINQNFAISGKGIIIETLGYRLPEQKFTFVSPGKPGHLSYIDGCSNTNLIDPARSGDPCLNYLYFPKNINQTFHTHPSIRVGIILSGKGKASINNQEIDLVPGKVFLLERHTLHRFTTSDSHMSLMVFHPDSEDGPRDEHNPMKSRTYI